MNRHRRSLIGASLVLATASLVAAGCGDEEAESGAKQASGPSVAQRTQQLGTKLGTAGTRLTAAGCEFRVYAEEKPTHVTSADELEWKTSPPTSGAHYEDWAAFGRYDEQVDDGYVLHNLEHGGVVVWVGDDVAAPVVNALAGLLDQDEKWLLMPRPGLSGIYSAAWTKGLKCPAAAITKLGPAGAGRLVDAWYRAVVSTGSEAEKNVPAFAGMLKSPRPVQDISTPAPFSS